MKTHQNSPNDKIPPTSLVQASLENRGTYSVLFQMALMLNALILRCNTLSTLYLRFKQGGYWPIHFIIYEI